MVDLTVSIVSADNRDQLLPCLQSVLDATHHITLEVWVVDNASTDGTAEAAAEAFPEVCLIRNEQRLGFSTNNNAVLAQSQGRYAMLLNDDTVVLDGALDTLVAFGDAHSSVGIVGSFLLNPDHTFQPSFSRFPNPWIEGIWSTAALLPRFRARAVEPFEVDTVCGAALMARRDAFEQVGLLDTQYDPLYAEETDWCFRFKEAGWQVYTHPGARIIHYGGQTMNRLPTLKIELLQRHKTQFFRKHFGTAAATFFKVSLCLSSLAKAAIHAPLSGWPKHAQKTRLYWRLAKAVPRF